MEIYLLQLLLQLVDFSRIISPAKTLISIQNHTYFHSVYQDANRKYSYNTDNTDIGGRLINQLDYNIIGHNIQNRMTLQVN